MIVFKGITHISIAGALFLVVNDFWNINIGIIPIMFFLALGSLLADIDHPSSILGRFVFPISAIVKHRNGFTHSFIGTFILPLPALFIGPTYYFFTIWGYLLHLLADTLTPLGVQWLYPITKKRFTLNLMKTGGAEEAIIVIMCLLFIFEKSWI